VARYANDSAPQLFQVAKYQLAADDAQGARWSFQRVLTLNRDFVPAEAALVELDLRMGQPEAALQRANKILGEHPDIPLGYLLTGDVLMHLQRYSEAAEAYGRGLKISTDASLVIRLYRARREGGDNAKALQTLENWIVQHFHYPARVVKGSKMPRADVKVLDGYSIPRPPEGLLSVFNETVLPIAQQCKALALQNQALAQARDLVLPRLMNGEIAV